jgi:DNA-binding NtrC family response regulator
VSTALFSDRFLAADSERAIDLATGAEVTLRPFVEAGPARLHAWLRRSAALMAFGHPALVPLVDFGLEGQGRHFEAFGYPRAAATWTSLDAPSGRLLLDLCDALHARGLTLGTLHLANLVERCGHVALVPGESLGHPLSDGDHVGCGDAERRLAGEREALRRLVSTWGGDAPAGRQRTPHLVPRDTGAPDLLRQLADVLDAGVSGRPRFVELSAPVGMPVDVVWNAVARESRLHGYVPVCADAVWALGPGPSLAGPVRASLHGRHALVLTDSRVPRRAAASRLFLELGLDSERPHVLLALRFVGPTGCESAAAHSPAARGSHLGLSLAREQAVAYGAPDVVATAGRGGPTGPVDPGGRSWPMSADPDIVRSRSRIALALDAASAGRHAKAVRSLRDALGVLTRRDDLHGAAEASFALGRVMLTRGAVAQAADAFETARRLFERAQILPRSVLAAVFVGLAWTDAGRWLEAEAALRAALIAADALGERTAGAQASLALARCLLWQQRFREAWDALPGDPPHAAGGRTGRVAEPSGASVSDGDEVARWLPDPGVARPCLAARVALAREDVGVAGRSAALARERATRAGRPVEAGMACTALALVHAVLGDVPALRLQVEEGLRSARLAHTPLRAIRLRAVLAEGLLRAGKGAEARPLLVRLGRLDLGALPTVVRRPVEALLNRPDDAQASRGAIARQLPPAGRRPLQDVTEHRPTSGAGTREVADAVIDLLGLWQSVEDEELLVRRSIATLRGRVGAVATSCFGVVEARLTPVAVEGRDEPPHTTAERAAETGLVIAPGSTPTGLEAAVPIRSGGRPVGVLACRWPADGRPEWVSAGAILGAAAAVLAPCVRAVLDRRAAPRPPAESAAGHLVGDSEAIRQLRDEIQRAARAPFNVVIEGESGSGKELVARAIHRLGPRCHHRLCAVNCAALSDDLFEAELFGHARGAFTGAVAERKGLFEEADGGTLVLDEVGELSPRAQAKLLRAIQEGEVRRVGENFTRAVDARVIAASNRALRPAAAAGAFRRDLLYRLEVIRIVVPPLRERIEDIPLLAAHFWQHATASLGSRATLAPATLAALARYDWPGNVRELQNVMAALAVSAGRRGSMGPERLPEVIAGGGRAPRSATLDEARRHFETRYVRAALCRAGGRRAQAAADLGLTRQGLSKLMARLDIDAPGADGGTSAGGERAGAASPAAEGSSGPA